MYMVRYLYSVHWSITSACYHAWNCANVALHCNLQTSNEGSIIWKPLWPICHHCII